MRTLPSDYFTKPLSYQGAHHRVRAVRGRADLHACADCGRRAQTWSYEGGCPFERVGPLGPNPLDRRTIMSWSPDPDYYSARCRRCHVIYDRGHTWLTEPEPADPVQVNIEIYFAAMGHGDHVRANQAMNRLLLTEAVSA